MSDNLTKRQIVDYLLDTEHDKWTPDEAQVIARYLVDRAKLKTQSQDYIN